MRSLLLLPFLFLPACITTALWSRPLETASSTSRGTADYRIDAAGWQAPDATLTSGALLVRAHRVGGELAASLDRALPSAPWFELRTMVPADLDRLRELMAAGLLGPLDAFDLHLQWQAVPGQSTWTCRLDLGGALAVPGLQPVAAERLPTLLDGAQVVPLDASAAPELRAGANAVEALDWSAVRPELGSGQGRVDGVLSSSTMPADAPGDLLIHFAANGSDQYLRLPARSAQALAGVEIADGRFRFAADLRARVTPGPTFHLAPLDLPPGAGLRIRSKLQQESISTMGVVWRVLVTPLTAVADVALFAFTFWDEGD